MPTPEIEEFARLLIAEVRDRSIATSDRDLNPDANSPIAKRWRSKAATGSARDLADEMIPDCVDETLGNLMQAIDSGILRLSFLASNGRVIDLTNEGMGELAGWYMGPSDGWRVKYSRQRFVDDFRDLREWASRRFGAPKDESDDTGPSQE
jgi:hypothetical protein